MPNSVAKPSPKYPLIEEYIFHSNFIKIRLLQKGLLVVLPIENCKPNNWYTRKNNIVKLIKNIVVNCGAAKKGFPSKHPNWNDIKHIFVEHVINKIGVAPICLSAVAKK